jgi:hypothetical protein
MTVTYTHLELSEDINALAGYYTPQKEVRLPYGGREVLYVVSDAVVDSSCCGTADFKAALIPGYILKWRAEKNEDGLYQSEVEPITDKTAKDSIRRKIREAENVTQVEFW